MQHIYLSNFRRQFAIDQCEEYIDIRTSKNESEVIDKTTKTYDCCRGLQTGSSLHPTVFRCWECKGGTAGTCCNMRDSPLIGLHGNVADYLLIR